MDAFKKILAIIDPTASEQRALDKAAVLARRFQATLELLLCDTAATLYERTQRQARDHASHGDAVDWLNSLAAPLRNEGMEVDIRFGYGEPLHKALLSKVNASSADLIVKDTHHHSLIRRTFLSNTDWYLIRGCRAPLLLTKATRWHDPIRIGAAIDPGHPRDPLAMQDDVIVYCARLLTDTCNGSLDFFNCYYPIYLANDIGAGTPIVSMISEEALNAEREAHLSRVDDLINRLSPNIGRRHVDLGVPGPYLEQATADAQVDILVMGALSRSHLKQMLLGGTAESVLEHIGCDILTVKLHD